MTKLNDSVIGKTALARFVTKIKQMYLPLSGGTVTGNLMVNGRAGVKGGLELYGSTPYMDFHYANSTADYTSRIYESGKGVLSMNSSFFINSSGQVAVGGANFDQSLYVNGAAVLSYDSGGNTSLYLRGGIEQASWDGGGVGFSIKKEGNATFAGTVTCQRVSQTSDRRMKKRVRDVRCDDTDRAREVRLVEFVYRHGKDRSRKYGVVAQELEDAGLGNLVAEDGGGMKSVDYTALLCLKVRMLERRVAALENGVPEAQAAPMKKERGWIKRLIAR